jgi:hypothetical protein
LGSHIAPPGGVRSSRHSSSPCHWGT